MRQPPPAPLFQFGRLLCGWLTDVTSRLWPLSSNSSVLPGVGLTALVLCTMAHQALLLTSGGSPALRTGLSNTLYLTVMGLGAALCWICAGRAEPASRLAWRCIAAGLSFNALGEGVYTALELRLGEAPSPSLADALFLLGLYPSLAAGLLALPRRPLGRLEALRLGLDVGVFVGACGVVAWYSFMAGLLSDASSPLAQRLVSGAYPVLDLALMGLLFTLARRREQLSASEALLAAGLACLVGADLVYQFQDAHGSYQSGQPTDALWTWATTLMVAGAYLAAQPAARAWPQLARASLRWAARSAPLLPYLSLAACGWTLYLTRSGHSLQAAGVFWGTALVTLLVALRQSAALAENATLNRDLSRLAGSLEARVQARTAELDQANHALQALTSTLEHEVQRRTAELETSRASLAHQAQHDALTGLPNRTLFQDRLGQAIARAGRGGQQVAVLFLDLDGFKHVNDTLGHAAGDALLVETAARLQATVRASDTVARLGGDEFTLILSDLHGPQGASKVAHKVLEAVRRPHELGGRTVRVTGSIGVALYPQDGVDAAALHMHADIAMYQAKQGGKADLRFFAPDMNAAAVERLELETQLRRALEKNELSLHYQPLFAAAGRPLLGFEALLRWTSPELGQVAPDRFIPVAEDSGLIIPIGEWVLDQACAQLAGWRAAGHSDIQMAVNVSPMQFSRPDFVDTVRRALARHGLPGAALELELTERLIVEDPALAATTLTELHALGVSIAIDDFGTGHSALSYLLHLPVQTLKIDRAFVQNLHAAADGAARHGAERVVQAIVSLAHALGLDVVAEGVETEAQRRRIDELGCERAQGYLLGRPLPPDEAERLLAGRMERV